jgi:hypothetical protein
VHKLLGVTQKDNPTVTIIEEEEKEKTMMSSLIEKEEHTVDLLT